MAKAGKATGTEAASGKMPSFLSQSDVEALDRARHGDPFAVLGPHKVGRNRWIVTVQPDADTVSAIVGTKETPLERIFRNVFAAPVPGGDYLLRMTYGFGPDFVTADPYAFGPVLGEMDAYLMGEGTHRQLWRALGAHVMDHEGSHGTHFAVWAPNAQRVSVVGDFNSWDGRRHVMRRVGQSGVWEIFVPGLGDGTLYKYEVVGADGANRLKADPVGFGSQHPPEKASVVRDISGYGWHDGDWMARRKEATALDQPISIYEVHLGSWRRRWVEGEAAVLGFGVEGPVIEGVFHTGFVAGGAFIVVDREHQFKVGLTRARDEQNALLGTNVDDGFVGFFDGAGCVGIEDRMHG